MEISIDDWMSREENYILFLGMLFQILVKLGEGLFFDFFQKNLYIFYFNTSDYQ